MYLLVQAKPLLNGGKVSQLLDPVLGESFDRDQMERMVLAATLCVRHAPRARPQMNLVSHLYTFFVGFLSGYRNRLSSTAVGKTPTLDVWFKLEGFFH